MQHKAVTVCIRTRPTANFAQDNLKINEESNTIDVSTSSSSHATTGPNNAKQAWSFKYDRVLHNSTQEGTYNAECSKIVETVVDGYNATIFAYGQTGAGKTFTMIGNTGDFGQRGVTPRALNQLFREVEVRTDMDFTITASYLEIYNERIFDLLDDITNENQTSDYQIVEDKNGSTTVKGLTRVPVNSEEDALSLLFKGELGRTTATHLLNKRSNRSHCVFTLYVEQRSKLGGSEHIKTSKLNLVDLAGSERLKKTGADTDSATKRESMYINKSLSYLEQVVVALTTKSRSHIPYRQTKLTNILRDSLGGNCMTLMIACIWAEASHLEETISTLQLAQRMMKVRNKTQVNQHQDPTLLLKKYERTIKELRQELVMHDALSERVGVVYEEFTPEQLSNIKNEVNQYLSSSSQEDDDIITIASVKQIREVFKEFKRVHKQLSSELEYAQQHGGNNGGSVANGGTSNGGEGGENGSGTAGDGSQVGELEDGNGFGLGNAASTERPANLDRPGYEKNEAQPDEEGGAEASSPKASANQREDSQQAVPADKNKAYAMFKENVASDLRDELARLNAITRGNKADVRAMTASINKCTADIKRYSAILEEKKKERLQRGEGSDIIDEEEFLTIKENKKARAAYREQLQQLKTLKSTLSLSKDKALQVKSTLLDRFEEWFKENSTGASLEEEEQEEDPQDELDYGERFEEMERERIRNADPDSVAFFNSRKLMNQTKRATRTGAQHAMAKKRSMQR